MLELSGWFFALLLNFLVLLFVLNLVLFKPMLRVFKERDDSVKGSMSAAREMSEKKDASLAEMKRELSEARDKARTAFEALRAEGIDRQKAVVSTSGEKAAKLMDDARQTLRRQGEAARVALRGDVERFSEEIVKKLTAVK